MIELYVSVLLLGYSAVCSQLKSLDVVAEVERGRSAVLLEM